MIQKCKTDKEFRLCGYGPIVWGGDMGISIRLRIDLPTLRFGIFWHGQSKIELGMDDLGEIIKAIGKYSNNRFCNKCGSYFPALLTQEIQEKNWGKTTVCYECRPDLFEVMPEEVNEDFRFLMWEREEEE